MRVRGVRAVHRLAAVSSTPETRRLPGAGRALQKPIEWAAGWLLELRLLDAVVEYVHFRFPCCEDDQNKAEEASVCGKNRAPVVFTPRQ